MITIISGDVVTYEEEENYFVTHRVVEKDGNIIKTKGDRNNELDTEISKSKIVGKVIFHSLFWGNFVVNYLKYVFIGFTIFIILINVYWCCKGKKENVEDGNEGKKEVKDKTNK